MTAKAGKRAKDDLSPVMRQYVEIKRAHRDCVLFFRMGDFYEMFYEDAELASRVLGIALTSRDKGENPIPMAGVPYHAAAGYIARMIRAGQRVAVCEQTATDGKIFLREVTRVVTPGTVTDEDMLSAREPNYLLAVNFTKHAVGIAWADVSTGEFRFSEVRPDRVGDEIERIAPAEILIPSGAAERVEILKPYGNRLMELPAWVFDADNGARTLREHLKVATLEGFGIADTSPGLGAAGAVVHYLAETQKGALGQIRKIERFDVRAHVVLDRATFFCLELLRTQRGGAREGSLLGTIDRTVTGPGARLLAGFMSAPLIDHEKIRRRLSTVREMTADHVRRSELRKILAKTQDLERLASRVACLRATPRDLLGIANSTAALPQIAALFSGDLISEILSDMFEDFDTLTDVSEKIRSALADTPPTAVREGGIFKKGYSPELDELRALASEGRSWIARYQAEEAQKTGIPNLKIAYNRVFGYYIEVSNVNRDKVPERYERRQTLKGGERYVTPELKDYERKVLTAGERANALEQKLFEELREELAPVVPRLQAAAAKIALLDVFAALAELAVENNYVEPEVDDSEEIEILNGRHPVIEKTLADGPFVPNDTRIDTGDNRTLIVTGPNMAGKSTYIRQVALIVLMAQMGSFVPAGAARIGVVDRVFTRLGASDEIMRGASTFMVEMTETANIVNNASQKSLIILDEVGRGTSTYDGLSIAWAVTEHIHSKIRARTMFATHYHELVTLERNLDGVRNLNVAVDETGGKITFLRKIVPGGADKSYGIHVAELAGIPHAVIRRAREILANLEAETQDVAGRPKFAPPPEPVRGTGQLLLFADLDREIAAELEKVEMDKLTPLDALNFLNHLKNMINKP